MSNDKQPLTFTKKNYILMLAGIGLVIIGLLVMTQDTERYGFGFLGITLGPVLLMSGFIVEFFAILHRDKKAE